MIEQPGVWAGIWAAITSFVKFILPLFPGAVGAALALKFLGEGIGRWQKVTSFAVGLASAAYVAPILVEWLSITSAKTQSGLEFLIGLFALAVTRELFKEINEADIIGSIKRKYGLEKKP